MMSSLNVLPWRPMVVSHRESRVNGVTQGAHLGHFLGPLVVEGMRDEREGLVHLVAMSRPSSLRLLVVRMSLVAGLGDLPRRVIHLPWMRVACLVIQLGLVVNLGFLVGPYLVVVLVYLAYPVFHHLRLAVLMKKALCKFYEYHYDISSECIYINCILCVF